MRAAAVERYLTRTVRTTCDVSISSCFAAAPAHDSRGRPRKTRNKKERKYLRQKWPKTLRSPRPNRMYIIIVVIVKGVEHVRSARECRGGNSEWSQPMHDRACVCPAAASLAGGIASGPCGRNAASGARSLMDLGHWLCQTSPRPSRPSRDAGSLFDTGPTYPPSARTSVRAAEAPSSQEAEC